MTFKCTVCGAKSKVYNPRTRRPVCSRECKAAMANEITRSEQLRREADSVPWGENPFECLDNYGRARRAATL
jgi:hypothetical protein